MGQVLWDKEEYEKAIAVYSELLGEQSEDAEAHNNLAWWLATCPDERFRDAERGIQHASRAVKSHPEKEFLTAYPIVDSEVSTEIPLALPAWQSGQHFREALDVAPRMSVHA